MILSSGPESAGLTVKETALLAHIPEKTVRHALASKVAQPGLLKRKGEPRFHEEVVTFFSLLRAMRIALPLKVKRDLCFLLVAGLAESEEWVRKGDRIMLKGPVPTELYIDPIATEAHERVTLYRTGRARLSSSPDIAGGALVFHGTRAQVRHVGLLVKRGASISELREDFPQLQDSDFEFARLFVELGRPRGRPRKKLRFRRSPA
jgi:uncharacterized protein (DUF433 family)